MTYSLPAGRVVQSQRSVRRNRRLWLTNRRAGVGASETAALFDMHPFATPLDVWLDKTGRRELDAREVSERAAWGLRLEDDIAEEFAQRHNAFRVLPSPGLLEHETYPRVLATIDRVLADETGPVAALEIKTTSEREFRRSWSAGVPAHIAIQVQQQLAVSGLPYAYVAVLVGGQHMPAPYLVKRDENAIALIVDQVTSWWAQHVARDVEPMLTYADAPNLSRLFPGDDDAPPLYADAELRELLRQYASAKERQRLLGAEVERLGFEIGSRMRDATRVVDDEARQLATWRSQTTRRVDTTRLREELPDVAAQYIRESATRVLRVSLPDDDEEIEQ